MSLREMTSIFSISILLWAGLAQTAPAQPPQSRVQALKEQLIEIPAGSVVEIRLETKQKLRGKLGTVNDSGFEVLTVRDGAIQSQSLGFHEIRSIKLQGKGMSTGAKIVLGALAGIGAFVLIVIAIAASRGWD